MNTAVALYLIVGAVTFLIGDLANGLRRRFTTWTSALIAVVMVIAGWPIFSAFVFWSVRRERRT